MSGWVALNFATPASKAFSSGVPGPHPDHSVTVTAAVAGLVLAGATTPIDADVVDVALAAPVAPVLAVATAVAWAVVVALALVLTGVAAVLAAAFVTVEGAAELLVTVAVAPPPQALSANRLPMVPPKASRTRRRVRGVLVLGGTTCWSFCMAISLLRRDLHAAGHRAIVVRTSAMVWWPNEKVQRRACGAHATLYRCC
jgi:hypothetical protein